MSPEREERESKTYIKHIVHILQHITGTDTRGSIRRYLRIYTHAQNIHTACMTALVAQYTLAHIRDTDLAPTTVHALMARACTRSNSAHLHTHAHAHTHARTHTVFPHVELIPMLQLQIGKTSIRAERVQSSPSQRPMYVCGICVWHMYACKGLSLCM